MPLGAVGGTSAPPAAVASRLPPTARAPRKDAGTVGRVSATPFDRIHHLVTVPVLVGERTARFVLDTGIGLTLLSDRLCAAIGCRSGGSTFTGRRMSGQEVTVPLATAPPLAFGGATRRDHVVGIMALDGFPPELGAVDGFLSLAFFDSRAVHGGLRRWRGDRRVVGIGGAASARRGGGPCPTGARRPGDRRLHATRPPRRQDRRGRDRHGERLVDPRREPRRRGRRRPPA